MVRLFIIMLAMLIIAKTTAQQQVQECSRNGKFTWVSYACTDKYPGCKDTFTFDAQQKKISDLCAKTENAKKMAIAVCPKSCRFCCLTPEYNCPDKQDSPIPCEKVTKTMCESQDMREILLKNCPGTCGFCLLPKPDKPVSDCPADNANCPNWVANGYCNNTFYTTENKKQHCGHACKLC